MSTAGHAGSASPLSASIPLGTSMATVAISGRNALISATMSRMSRTTPSSGLIRPIPSTASTTTCASPSNVLNCAKPGSSDAAITGRPRSFTMSSLGSGARLSRQMYTLTRAPQRCRCRATTSPSPPLLPGPTSTTTDTPNSGEKCRRMYRADSSPARSISASLETPVASERSSIRRI